jgi:hypothetical protein
MIARTFIFGLHFLHPLRFHAKINAIVLPIESNYSSVCAVDALEATSFYKVLIKDPNPSL